MRTAMGEFSREEIEQLVKLLMKLKRRLGPVAREALALARDMGIDQRIVRASITFDCLELAAKQHIGTRDEFMKHAAEAIDRAEHDRPALEGAMQ